MFDLRKEKEILPYDKKKPQILNANNCVENMFLAVGFASRCWTKKDGRGTFDYGNAVRIANELCAYFRIISTKHSNLEFLEWKYGKLKGKKK